MTKSCLGIGGFQCLSVREENQGTGLCLLSINPKHNTHSMLRKLRLHVDHLHHFCLDMSSSRISNCQISNQRILLISGTKCIAKRLESTSPRTLLPSSLVTLSTYSSTECSKDQLVLPPKSLSLTSSSCFQRDATLWLNPDSSHT